MEEGFKLREVFNSAVVNELAQSIATTWHDFDQQGFSKTINSQLDSLNFGERSNLIRDTLWEYLPKDYPQAIQILLKSLGPEIQECEITGFDRFVVMSQN